MASMLLMSAPPTSANADSSDDSSPALTDAAPSASRRDRIDKLRNLRLGESISRGVAWGRPLRLYGIQWRSGDAAPADTRRDGHPAGLRGLRIEPPSITKATLLARGASVYSLEGGAMQSFTGEVPGEIGESVAIGTHRFGLSDAVTLDFRGEGTATARAVGGGATVSVPPLGILMSAHGAASESANGAGTLCVAGVDHQAGPFTFGSRVQWASERFRQAGVAPNEIQVARNITAVAGTNFAEYGAASASFTRRTEHSGGEMRFATLSYTVPVTRAVSTGISTTRVFGVESATTVMLLMSLSLEDRSIASFVP